jgi:glycosyltransferase involved in cell wall biosynthesis
VAVEQSVAFSGRGATLAARAAELMNHTLDCSVIIPVLDERESMVPLVEQIVNAFAELDRSFEIVFVDDGSRDGTWDEIVGLSRRFDVVRGVRLRRNFGKSTALAAGVEQAKGAVIITMDGDLQDDPAEIPRFLEMLDGRDRLVSGWKMKRLDPLSKRLPSKLFNAVTSWACGVKMHDHNCGFKAAPAAMYRAIPMYGELHRYVPALAHDLGYEVVEIPVNHRARTYGRSKFGLERYVRGLLDLITVLMITRYRRRPGHFLGGLGVLLGALGFAMLTYLSGVWLLTDQAIGTRPLLALGVLLVVVSLQLFIFGIIAELIVNTSQRRSMRDVTAEHTVVGKHDGGT